ncbi:outer membrane beta-barrel protein [Spongiibacter taiwanensis]|uniref:OmpW/AlkL family protein n=1 Tax=Spongiibacter taiwanensis TaxID=1748242 RepID=UPI002035847E|nr:OmpW family outer membrane protein [Spongiibacter taiwanensis]USA44649.1 outer membrane beta-barrel protein [Spongiibacter taiwanensis]
MKTIIIATPLTLALVLGAQASAAFEAGDILVRIGATTTDPRESSEEVELNRSIISLSGGRSGIGLNSNTQLGANIEYFLTPQWGVELLVATPFEHEAEGTGELQGLTIAEFKHLPPTLSLVYHLPRIGRAQPYAGVGLNYTFLFDEEITAEADAAFAGLGLNDGKLKLDDSFGVAVQLGVDFHIDNHWLVNASVRWIDLETDAEIRFAGGNKVTSTIEVDPFVYTLSVGYLF